MNGCSLPRLLGVRPTTIQILPGGLVVGDAAEEPREKRLARQPRAPRQRHRLIVDRAGLRRLAMICPARPGASARVLGALYQRLVNLARSIPAVLVTAYAGNGVRERKLSAGGIGPAEQAP